MCSEVYWKCWEIYGQAHLRTSAHENALLLHTNKSSTQKQNTEITALCVWFDVEFSARFCANPVTLSTAPGDPPTHWEQLVLPLKHPLQVQSKDIVKCQLSMARGTQHRTLDIAAQVQVGAQPVQIMSFQMGVDDEE